MKYFGFFIYQNNSYQNCFMISLTNILTYLIQLVNYKDAIYYHMSKITIPIGQLVIQ